MQKPLLREGSHTDAVLGLAWNAAFRNVLASGSADKQVKVWDVASLQCTATLSHHTGKVQAVAWNPAEAPVLLSGGFDHQLHLVSQPVLSSLSDQSCILLGQNPPAENLRFIQLPVKDALTPVLCQSSHRPGAAGCLQHISARIMAATLRFWAGRLQFLTLCMSLISSLQSNPALNRMR